MDYRLPESTRSFAHFTQHPYIRFLIALHNFLLTTLPLLPAHLSVTTIRQVLDAVCGTGTWVNALLQVYPHLEVMGIERDQQLVEYARAYASRAQSGHSNFLAADLLDLPISPQFFDLVHARFLPPVATRAQRRLQVHALARVCAPEGYLVWTEWTWPVSNGEACGKLYRMLKHALVESLAMSDAPHEMETLLAYALALPVSALQVQEILLSYPSQNAAPHNTASVQEVLITLLNFMRFFLLTHHIARAREVDTLLQQCQSEIYAPNFNMSWTLKTVVGQKPLHF